MSEYSTHAMPVLPRLPVTAEAAPVWRHPPMLDEGAGTVPTPTQVEALLTEWFGASTLLFSSGRAACHVLLTELGFDRNRHTIRVPPFLTRCILNALALDAFPVREGAADAVLYYHPFGLRLRAEPREPIVVEDGVHAFFTAPTSGVRAWRGPGCLFSLSKFFSTSGIVGALVVPDAELAKRVAARRDRSADAESSLAAWRQAVIVGTNAYGDSWAGARLLDSAYSLLTEFPKVDPRTLCGVPATLDELQAHGRGRLERFALFEELLGDAFPHDVLEHGLNDLLFALPYFGSSDRTVLARIDIELAAIGVRCKGVYALNVGGSMYDPVYRDGLLLPCHQYISLDIVEQICHVIRRIEKN